MAINKDYDLETHMEYCLQKQKPVPGTKRNNKLVRSQNIKRILLLVKNLEPVSMETLVQESSLTYPTVLGIIKYLEKESHVENIAYAPTTGGRQAVLYGICGIVRYVLALHLNGDEVDITITNIRDGKIFHATEAMPAQAVGQDQTERTQSIAKRLVPLVEEVLRKTRLELSSLVRICVTYPECTRVDPQQLSDVLEASLQVPVSTVSDRRVLNFLERRSYHISSLQQYIFILFERELSLSMYRGPGETSEGLLPKTYFGHMTMDVAGASCTCGKQGCLQSYVSGEGLLQSYSEAAQLQGSTWNSALEHEPDLFHAVLAESYKGDKAARVAIDQAIHMMAVALANVIKIEGISTIVLSGVFTSTDVQYKRFLEMYVAEYLPEDYPSAPVIILGTSSPSDCSYAACLMMNAQFFESLSFS
ncbi:MAG: ROK family protein [Sphaerochaeta sp.]|nr:ROK family protein [Sphaerochaeta sp.]